MSSKIGRYIGLYNASTNDVITLNGSESNGVATYQSAGNLTIESSLTYASEQLFIGVNDAGGATIQRRHHTSDNGGDLTIIAGAPTISPTSNNKSGGDLILKPGYSTGSGTGGDIILQTVKTTSGTAGQLNNWSDSVIISGTNVHLAEDMTLSFEGASDGDYETTLTVADPSADRTITLPNADGTVQLQGSNTGQIINVSLMKDDNYVLYLNTRTYWYSTAGYNYTGNINVSAGNWSSWSDDRQARHCGYIATQACKVNKVRFVGLFATSYTSGALDFEFALQKWTPGNDTTATVTTTYMTHTDHDGSYTEGKIYNLEFDVSGNNTLAAGDAFTLFARCVDSNASARIQIWYGNCHAQVELT